MKMIIGQLHTHQKQMDKRVLFVLAGSVSRQGASIGEYWAVKEDEEARKHTLEKFARIVSERMSAALPSSSSGSNREYKSKSMPQERF